MRWSIFLALFSLVACGQLTREDLLSGNFGNLDRSPPTPLSPAPDAVVKNLTAEFSWSTVFQATKYTLEVSANENFTAPIPGSPFETRETSLTVNFPDDRDYFWRLRANTTEQGVYSAPRRVRVLGNIIRVYCPAAKPTCGNPDAIGNKSAPYENLQPALNRAAELGLSEVQVAARGGSAFYEAGTITLLNGIHLRGGYEANNWQRDIEANATEVRSSAQNLLLASGLTQATQVEGFTLRTMAAGTVFRCLNSNGLALRKNKIFTGNVTGNNAYAINTLSCNSLTIQENQITMGNAISTVGSINPIVRALELQNSQATIEQNTIRGGSLISGSAGDGNVIRVAGSNVLVNSNTIRTGQAGANGALVVVGPNTTITVSNSTIICESRVIFGAEYCLYFDSLYGPITATVRDNYIEISSYAGSTGIRASGSSASGVVFNNVILADTVGLSQLQSQVHAHNNTIILSDLFLANKTGAYTWEAAARNFQNNIIAVLHGTGNRYCVHYDSTSGNGFARFENNNLFGCTTALFRQGSTDYPHMCTDGMPGTAAGCTSGVNIASTSTSGNVNIDNASNQLFVNIPKATDLTEDGPDASFTYDGTTNTVEVRACNVHGQYAVGEYIEYDRDGIARQITAVNCTASASTITFTPPLSSASQRFKSIRLWGSNNTNLTIDARLKAPTTPATCNVVYGGLNLSSSFTTDLAGITRTASLPTSGVCAGNVTNAGAAGWSLGAYERD